jgi:hypothetical protein
MPLPPAPQAELTEAQAKVEADKLHSSFMKLLLDALDSSIDSSGYEDACRTMLGTNSYQLFTLDKLVHKLVKHMQSMLQVGGGVRGRGRGRRCRWLPASGPSATPHPSPLTPHLAPRPRCRTT